MPLLRLRSVNRAIREPERERERERESESERERGDMGSCSSIVGFRVCAVLEILLT